MLRYKIYTYLLIPCCFLLILVQNRQADYEISKWNIFPVIGMWFGPVAPFPNTVYSSILKTNLGGGLFIRTNFPTNVWMIEAGTSLNYYDSNITVRLYSLPTYGSIVYKLPIELPISFLFKLGLGFNYFRNKPENNKNTHPAIFIGYHMFFPAGTYVNIGLRIDYYAVFESYLDTSTINTDLRIHNGHFINIGLSLSFNIKK